MCVLFFFLGFSRICHAELLVYDGFDYTGTNLVDADGGMGWSNSWRGGYFAEIDCEVSLGTESYAGLDACPYVREGKHVYDTKTNIAYMVRTFSRPISTTNQHDIYLSFVYDRGTNGLGQPWSPVGLCSELNGTRIRFNVGGSYDSTRLQVEIAGKRNTWNGVLTGTNTAFYVAKIAFEADGEIDHAFANLYWEGDEVPVAEPGFWTHSVTNATNAIQEAQLIGIYIKVYAEASPFVFDEFRLGTTWEDVAVPPPSGSVMTVR